MWTLRTAPRQPVRSRRTTSHLVTAAAALAVALPALGAVAAPAAAAPGDDVVAWVEVEDGVIAGGPGLNSGDHGNFSGTGSYTFRETGMSSTMSVTAPEAGVYPIHVRYAAGPLGAGENVTRSMGLLTNGGARRLMQLPMTSLEDWETWRFVTYQVTLAEGANTVALQCDRSTDFCRLNFDAVQVGGAAPDPCAATPADPGATSLFDGTFASFDGWRKAGAGAFGRQTDCTIRSFRGRGATWFTQQQSEPYTLELDWRRTASNDDSSLYVASSSRGGADPVGGYKIAIGADTGAIVPTGGAMQAADRTAVAGALHPLGEWNTYRVQVTASRIRVSLNDVVVNSLARTGTAPVTGYVGLENRSASDEVDFRSIQVRPGVDPDASTTSLTVAPTSVPVRRGTAAVSVAVASSGDTPTGAVEVWSGATRLTTLTLAEGRATGTVGPFASVGAVPLEAHYVGDTATGASASPLTTLTVRKAASTVSVKAQPRKVVARKTRATVRVAVSALGVVPSGKVRVKVGARTFVGTLRGGVATVRLPRFTKAGTVRVTATYLGDALAEARSARTTIKVTRARR
ncbi:family 16 glycoside hydrolase [Nocardioides lijunqiniae]|uniref:family 16 glycoside hydrolase n=1 Tax=Nocardioides lijunqiniae TaxID=2760832 RepID=UPI001877529C|nr:family 16 glycoside hydrolase [Nocardioides lijunqiniae]